MRVQGVLFDFDHTLVDSPIDFAGMRRGVYDHLDTLGLAVPDRDRKLILEVLDEAVVMADGVLGDRLREAAERHILNIELTAAAQARPVPGVPEALARLRDQGRRIGIITRNCREVVDGVLRRVPLDYDVLLTRNEVARLKPEPEHAWEALEQMGVSVDQAILIGDFRGDVECALRAGILPVGVTTGSADEAALRAAGAAYVLPTAAVVPEWLAERGW